MSRPVLVLELARATWLDVTDGRVTAIEPPAVPDDASPRIVVRHGRVTFALAGGGLVSASGIDPTWLARQLAAEAASPRPSRLPSVGDDVARGPGAGSSALADGDGQPNPRDEPRPVRLVAISRVTG